MANSLFLIYTLFDDLVKDYTSLFKLTNVPEPKAILFHKVYQGPAIDKVSVCDIILLPDETSDIKDISPFIASVDQVFGVLHKGKSSSHKSKRREFLKDLAGDKLQYPVLEEHHSTGKVFEILVQLGKAFAARSQPDYELYLTRLKNLFEIDPMLEARKELLHLSMNLNGIQQLINNEVPDSGTRQFLISLIRRPNVRRLLYTLRGKIDDPVEAAKLRQQLKEEIK